MEEHIRPSDMALPYQVTIPLRRKCRVETSERYDGQPSSQGLVSSDKDWGLLEESEEMPQAGK